MRLFTRIATSKDIQAIQALVQAVLESKQVPTDTERQLKHIYSTQAFWKTIASDNRHIILALSDNDFVGMCQYGIPIMDDCDCEDLREIHTLFVHPEYPNEQVIEALVAAVEDSINEDAAVQRLSIFVDANDITLIKLYARLGFHHDQVEDQENEWYMEKDL